MPRNGSGTYTLPTGNPVVAGTTIEASWANNTLADVATELTGSLSRSGAGGMTGPLRLDAGTSGVPGLAWGAETTTGFYRAGTNDMRLAVATADVQQWTASGTAVTGTLSASGAATLSSTLAVTGATTLTGALTLNGGIANNPTLTAGTANGVLYLDGSKVATSGSGLTFDGTNLGIGTASPASVLHIEQASASLNLIAPAGNAVFRMGNSASGANRKELLITLDNANNRVDIQAIQQGVAPRDICINPNGGNLGIGTASPNAPLTFAASTGRKVGFFQSTQGYSIGVESSEFRFVTDSSAIFSWRNGSTYSSSTEYMRLDASGNLGIGTASPAYRLHLNSASAVDIETAVVNTAGLSRYGTRASGNAFVGAFTASRALELWSGGAQSAILDASGNLGVAGTSTGSRVHIFGTSGVLLRAGTASGNGTTDFWPAMFGDGDTAASGTNRNFVRIGRFSDGTAGIDAFAAGVGAAALGFGAFGTRTMTLDASGNLGINTATFGTSAAGVLALGTGTAPTTGPADTVQLFSVDRSAGNTIPAIRCEGSGVTNAGITNTTVTNKIAVQVNGTIYYLLATTNAT